LNWTSWTIIFFLPVYWFFELGTCSGVVVLFNYNQFIFNFFIIIQFFGSNAKSNKLFWFNFFIFNFPITNIFIDFFLKKKLYVGLPQTRELVFMRDRIKKMAVSFSTPTFFFLHPHNFVNSETDPHNFGIWKCATDSSIRKWIMLHSGWGGVPEAKFA